MLSRLFNLGDGLVTRATFYLRHPWPGLVVLLLIVAAAAYAAVLYRKEKTLSVRRRVLLGTLRAALYAVVILMLFEPTLAVEMQVQLRRNILVLFDRSASMAIADARTAPADVADAAKALGKAPFDQPPEAVAPDARRDAAAATRLDLAKGLLSNPNLRLFERLGEQVDVRYFAFGERLTPAKGEGEAAPATLMGTAAEDPVTRLGASVSEAVARYGGQPIVGVIVLTDGAGNDGLEPLEVARRMKDLGVPLFPVGIGLPDPPDVKLHSLSVSETVFVNDQTVVRVQVASTGYEGSFATVTARLDGATMDSRRVALTNGTQFVELTVEPKTTAEAAKLEVSVTELPGETTAVNNVVGATLKVIDEKIKVIYVEGKPRWEYRYLRRVLLRDHRLNVKFLMTEGDRDLALHSEENLAEFPVEAEKAFDFDLVILGDVPSSYFSPAQLKRIEELIRQREGSLLMLAGFEHAPASYIGTPIEDLLPVKIGAEGWRNVPDEVFPRITAAGERSAIAVLEAPAEANEKLWSQVRPMYRLPAIGEVKGGATVLAELSEGGMGGAGYPLISWQRVGRGKSMLVGTDQLWRLRLKRGDKYHARFWGQTIQFLTLSRLLGGNKRIQIAAERGSVRQGEPVAVTVSALDEAYAPLVRDGYDLEVRGAGGDDSPVRLHAEPVAGAPGMFQAVFTPDRPGRYVIRDPSADEKTANSAAVDVTPSTLEQREPAMQEALLRKMAELSGGRYYAMTDLPTLPEALHEEVRTVAVRRDHEMWDLPVVLAVVLLLAGAEWLLRRRYDLI